MKIYIVLIFILVKPLRLLLTQFITYFILKQLTNHFYIMELVVQVE